MNLSACRWKRGSVIFVLFCLLVSALPGLCHAQGKGKGKDKRYTYKELIQILKTAKPAPTPFIRKFSEDESAALSQQGIVGFDPAKGIETATHPQILGEGLKIPPSSHPGQIPLGLSEESLALAESPSWEVLSPGGEGGPMGAPSQPIKVEDTLPFPWRTIYKLLMRFNDGNKDYYYVCSASSAGSFHLLTAGHCIYNHDINDDGITGDSGFAKEIWAWAGMTDRVKPINKPDHPYGVARGVFMNTYPGWLLGDYNHDWGVITLDRRRGDQTGWMDRETIDTSTLNFSGYPGFSGIFQYRGGDPDNVINYTTYQITLDAITSGGQSGMPYWRFDGTSRWVQGIHSHLSISAGYLPIGTRLTLGKRAYLNTIMTTDEVVRPPIAKPDIVEYVWSTTAKDLLTNTAAQGDSIQVKYNSFNAGFADTGTITFDFYLSPDTNIEISDTKIGTRTHSGLDPLDSINPTTTLTVPTNLVPGTYYVGWIMSSAVEEYPLINLNDPDLNDVYHYKDNTVVIADETLDVLGGPTCTPDGFEPDNSSGGSASNLNPGQRQIHSICPVGDEDWVRFTLTEPSNVILETSGSIGDTEMWLYNTSLSQVEYNDDGGTGFFSKIDRVCGTDELAAGTYYVKIGEYANNETINSYNIDLTTVSCSNLFNVSPSSDYNLSNNAGGSFSPPSKAYQITNNASYSVDYSVAKSFNWLNISNATGTLSAGQSVTVIVSPNINANSLGTGLYTDTLIFTNITSGTGTTFRTVNLTSDDGYPPVITILGNNPATVSVGAPYNDAGATANDNVDGPVSVNVSGLPINTSVPGTFTVTYTATDSAGNTATATRTVNVVDTTPPVITLLGDNPTTVTVNFFVGWYEDAGATAIDNVDGPVPVFQTGGPVDLWNPGTYTLNYEAVDAAGNFASVTRTVHVVTIPHKPKDDLNGDGTSDIIRYNTVDGTIEVDFMVNGTPTTTETILAADPTLGWTLNSTGDFNGDLKSDLALYNTITGDIRVVLLDGSSILGDAVVLTLDTLQGYVPFGAGDFDGDGKSEIALFNQTTKGIDLVTLDGTTFQSRDPVTGPHLFFRDWKLITIGEFTGDGKSDFLWYWEWSGELALSLMDGASLQWQLILNGDPTLEMEPVDSADYNGDDFGDILMFNKVTRQLIALPQTQLEPGFLLPQVPFGSLTATKNYFTSGDYDGNGFPDMLLFEPTTGDASAMFQDGTQMTSENLLMSLNMVAGWTVDYKPPVITLNGFNPRSVVVGTPYFDDGATAEDNLDGPITVNTSGLPIDTSVAGSFTVTYSATDSSGNIGLATRTVNVIDEDTTPPVITILGDNPITVPVGPEYFDPGATAVDDVEGWWFVTVSGMPVDTSAPGTHIVTYTSTDLAGNSSTATRTVIVEDWGDFTPPVITILGNNPETVLVGTPYTDAGATALDNVDGSVSVSVSGLPIDTSITGVHTITYTASDSLLNTAVENRIVYVVDPGSGVGGDLYGLSSWNTFPNNSQLVVKIDPVTGAKTILAGISTAQWFYGLSTLDDINDIFYFVSDDPATSTLKLFSVDLATGQVLSNPSAPPNGWSDLQFNSHTGKLYGLTSTGTFPNTTPLVVEIDPVTGAETTLATISTVQWAFNGTLDEANGIYYFIGAEATPNTSKLFGVNLTTGQILSSPPAPPNGWTDLEFNSRAGKLYGSTITGPFPLTTLVVEIDPVTGAETTLATISDVQWTNSGALDDTNDIMYFTGIDLATGNLILYSVDLTTGQVLSNTPLPPNNLSGIQVKNLPLPPSDTTPPVITVLGNNPETVSVGTAYVDAGATALDNVDGDLTGSIVTTGLPIDTSVPGSHTVTYEVTDAAGNTATATRTVNVVDTTPPVITVLGNNPETVNVGEVYNDAGATADDNVDGPVPVTTTGLPIDTSTTGTHTVTYEATDNAGNTATATRTVDVVDTTPPVITVLGNNPETVEVGAAYVDAGATANDNVDGDLTGSIVTTGLPIDTSAPGSHIVTYEVTDNAGNTTTASRTVDVVDTTPPVITVLGANPITVSVGGAYLDPGATATDSVDGPVPVNTFGLPISTGSPGMHTITYTATDNAGNTATATRTVHVVDTTPPVITILGNNPETVSVGAAYVDAGATANDNVDGPVAVVTSGLPISTSTPGVFQVNYSVTDSSGNNSVAVRTVNVVDDTPPVITVLGNNPETVNVGEVYNDAGATANDNVDGPVPVTTTGLPIDTSTTGTHTVTYEATDNAGNTATETRTVEVVDPKAHRNDFDGDGDSDLLAVHDDGTLVNVLLENSVLQNVGFLGQADPAQGWTVNSTGDINNDKKADILLYNTITGEYRVITVDGINVLTDTVVFTLDPAVGAEPRGMADFDGDGEAEIILYIPSNGVTALVYLNAGVFDHLDVVTTVDVANNYILKDYADFTGDGKTDLVTENTVTGETSVIEMDGSTPVVTTPIYVLDPSIGLPLRDTGDFTGDGKTDILTLHTSNALAVLTMDGLTFTGLYVPGSLQPSETLINAGRYDGDSKTDFLFHDPTTGAVITGIQDGATITSLTTVFALGPASGWSFHKGKP